VITTKSKKDEFIARGSEIEKELLEIFPRDAEIVIADIGCCDALSSVIYSRIFPNATFYLFEPVKENVEYIRENIKEYGIAHRCTVYPTALGNVAGRRRFFKSYGQAEGIENWETGNKSGSLLRPRKHLTEHKWCKFKEATIDVVPLDMLTLKPISFIHMDVQGAEMQVILGGRRAIKNVKAMWIEVANIDLYAHQPLKNNIVQYLSKDFKVIKDTCGDGKAGDILCLRKS